MKTLATGDGGMVWAKRPLIAETISNGVRLGIGLSGFHRRTNSAEWWEVDPVQVGRWARMNDAGLGTRTLNPVLGFRVGLALN